MVKSNKQCDKSKENKTKKNGFYGFLFVICLCFISIILESGYSTFLKSTYLHNHAKELPSTENNKNFAKPAKENLNIPAQKESILIGDHIEIGFRRGLLANVFNRITSGTYLLVLSSALYFFLELSSTILLIATFILAIITLVYIKKRIVIQSFIDQKISPTIETAHHTIKKSLSYDRQYSISSLIIIFFLFSFLGWLWEVVLHLIQSGTFVNRGVMHGPWLPIYGTGCVTILVLLKKLRNYPILEFLGSILLCGCMEYFIGLALEVAHDGQKWWNYNGYFLNVDGRICAEGLLLFGIFGIMVVYFLAPLVDNAIQRLPHKAIVTFCILFLVLFSGDKLYSSKYPNVGKGITNSQKIATKNNNTKPITNAMLAKR